MATNLHDLEVLLSKWHMAKYGHNKPDLQRALVKLMEEVGEIARAVLRDDYEEASLECADCLFLLCHISAALGYSLEEQTETKWLVIVERLRRKGKTL